MTQALLVLLAAVNPLAAAAGLAGALAPSPPGGADGESGPGRRDRLVTLFLGVDAAAALAVLLAWLSDPFLELLDVSPPTFRITAAVVVGVSGLVWLLRGASLKVDAERPADEQLPPSGPRRALVVPILVPVLVTPALVTASISMGADHGVVPVLVAAAVTLAVTTTAALVPCTGSPTGEGDPVHRTGWGGGVTAVVWSVGARLVGVLAIVMALALAVDGVKTV